MWRKQICLAAFVGLLAVMQVSSQASEGETAGIWLVYDGNMMPNSGDEITVYIHSDPMLFAMNTLVDFTGDVNITSAMSEADCNNYGWDNGWNSDPYIDPEGWLMINGVSWEGAVNDNVGYFKFRYYSGEVTVSINGESCAYDPNCQPVLFSGESLVFGSDPNQSLISGGILIDNNDVNQEPNQPPVIFDYNVLMPNRDRIKRSGFLPKCSDSNGQWNTFSSSQIQNNLNNIPNERFALNMQRTSSEVIPIEEREIVEVNSDITTNTIWTSNNVYWITSDVNVQALLVVEPGTIIYFYYNKLMSVNNGGTLISSGTPDNPIVYTADILYPDWGSYYNTEEFTWHGWYYYFGPIFIDETASPATTVTYCFIEGAFVGISLKNIKLDHPIENNYFSAITNGIVEYGQKLTDIINNLTFQNGWAIYVSMGDVNGTGDPDVVINIKNNTCYTNYMAGIDISGVGIEEQEGLVILSNNIVTNSGHYGVVLEEGYVAYIIDSTGYYNNNYGGEGNGNRFGYEESDEHNPVYETECPFILCAYETTISDLRLNPNSTFVNASDEYIEQTRLIGKTTDINGFPDSNKVDLGYHFPNWNYSNAGDANALSMDLNHDLIVNFKDLSLLRLGWRTTYDFNSLGIMADNWLKTPSIPPIVISGDSNTGYVNIDIGGSNPDIMQTYFYVDGQYMGINNDLDVSALGSGTHELKAVSIDINDRIICSNLLQTTFSCPFNYCNPHDAYELNEPYYFHAFYQGSGNITVKVFDENQNMVWSQDYPAENVNGFVPNEFTARENLDTIVFTHSSGGSSSMSFNESVSDDEIIKPLFWGFNPNKIDMGVRALFILPYPGINRLNRWVEPAVTKAFEAYNVPIYKLKESDAIYSNLLWFSRFRNIEYIYYAGHGNYRFNNTEDEYHPILRTSIGLYDGNAVSVKQSDFPSGGAPSWCETLPGNNERSAHSIYRLNFGSGQRLKFAYFDCCLAGRLRLTDNGILMEGPSGRQNIPAAAYSDMSLALGLIGDDLHGRFYQSWWVKTFKATGIPVYDSFSLFEWTRLKNGENLYNALNGAIGDMWTTKDRDLAIDAFRVYGTGDITSVEIR